MRLRSEMESLGLRLRRRVGLGYKRDNFRERRGDKESRVNSQG
jgi:hypothetical protein